MKKIIATAAAFMGSTSAANASGAASGSFQLNRSNALELALLLVLPLLVLLLP